MQVVKAKKVSIYTISRELGISPATVSRAINNHPAVSAEVRAKVQEMADRYQFRPRVVSNKVTNICVLIQQIEGHPLDFGAFLSQVMEGMALYCSHEELEMSLYSASVKELNRCDLVRELKRRAVDGVVIVRANDQTEYLKQLVDQRFPYLCVVNSATGADERVIAIDDEGLAYQAMRHLLELGHRRVGIFLNAPQFQFAHRRLKGYARAMEEFGVAFDERLVTRADPAVHRGGLQFGAEAVEAMLKREPGMTACCATCEQTAMGALCRLNEMGISVPGQVSVVAFDDFAETAYTCPPLTTVRVPYREIAYEAARQVHRMCRGLDVLMTEKVQADLAGELIVRKSTGEVRK